MAEMKHHYFVDRPIFATVISIIITLVGVIAINSLPIEQFPDMTPPQVSVTATYKGANADVVAQNVASLLESKINGVENMIYMNSVSTGSGSMTLNVTFAIGTDADQATINVNNRVQLAISQLPQEVQQMGVTVLKQNPSMLLIVAIYSPDKRYNSLYLDNYALLNIIDELKLVSGVGDVRSFSTQNYAIRIWMDPMKMAKYGVVPTDISAAVRSQNAQFAAGSLGTPPVANDIEMNMQIVATGRMSTPEEFGEIILRTAPDGTTLYLKDVARIELGGENYNFVGRLNGAEAIPLGIYTAPGANAIGTADAVKAKMEELSKAFPEGVAYRVSYDTTNFIRISIEEVIKTLAEAMILVFLVVFLFLQNWRATLIPCLAVPVSIIGTFAGMYALGFTINTLTMFGLVLAIGMVVDDAIVVLENVERHMSNGLSPKDATSKAMQEVTRPVIAIVLVLCSVFVPVAFTGGLAGKMYQQFAITIAISVVISGIVALTFTPALCALLLKPHSGKPMKFFVMFNSFFDKITDKYMGGVKFLIKRGFVSILLFCGMTAIALIVLARIPSGLVPNEDQGVVIAVAGLPEGASLKRTTDVVTEIEKQIIKDPTVDSVISFTGIDILSGAFKTNSASMFLTMKPWSERTQPGESSFDLVKKFYGIGMAIPQGYAMAFNPPAIMGLSTTGGVDLYIQNRLGASNEEMLGVVNKFVAAASTRPEIQGINNTFNINAPQLKIIADRQKIAAMGVEIQDVFSVMQATFGTLYINDFNLYGRTFRVYAQSEAEFRSIPENIKEVFVRNNQGTMTPLSSLVTTEIASGAQSVQRFNNFPAAMMTANPTQGSSSGLVMKALEEVAAETLPTGYTLAWSGSAYQERQVSGSSVMIFGLALIMVFLILAAQYESWSLPITVISAVPFAVFGAVLASWSRGFSNDIYFQVALVTLVGLAAKNAILIVEFASEKYKEGHTIIESAELAAKLRFRPIIMTSLAFIFGCVPLALSFGAGAASRHELGTAVIGGMLAATILAPLFVPYFFKLVMGFSAKMFIKNK